MLFFLYLCFCNFSLKGQINTKLKALSSEKQFSQIIKTNPIIQSEGNAFVFRGWHLGYETSMGLKSLSSFMSIKYQYKLLEDEMRLKFIKFEYQPRLWTSHLMQNFFITPTISFYSTGEVAWAALFGFQRVIDPGYSFESWIGIQKTTEIENFESNVFIRLGLNVGFLIVNKHKH